MKSVLIKVDCFLDSFPKARGLLSVVCGPRIEFLSYIFDAKVKTIFKQVRSVRCWKTVSTKHSRMPITKFCSRKFEVREIGGKFTVLDKDRKTVFLGRLNGITLCSVLPHCIIGKTSRRFCKFAMNSQRLQQIPNMFVYFFPTYAVHRYRKVLKKNLLKT